MASIPTRKVGKLELVNRSWDLARDRLYDGFGVIAVIDDKTYPECDPPRYEKELVLTTCPPKDPSSPKGECYLTVTFSDGTQEIVYPEVFDFQMGDLRVAIKDDYYPCQTLLGGYDVMTRSLEIRFAEGECPWVNLKFLPYSDMLEESERDG